MKGDFAGTIRFWLHLLVRRFALFAGLAALVLGLALKVILDMPLVYAASATLVVEAPQIPDDIAASSVQLGEAARIQVIQQRLKTQANLAAIGRQIDGFARGENDASVAGRIAGSLTIKATAGRDQATLLTITVTSKSAVEAAALANALAEGVVADNLAERQGLADDTEGFFRAEVTRLAADLSAAEGEILRFSQAETLALPSADAMRAQRLAELAALITPLEAAMDETAREIAAQRSAFAATGGTLAPRPDEAFLVRERERLEAELAQALMVYSSDNPKVKMLRARLDQILMPKVVPGDSGADALAQVVERLQRESEELQRELAPLREERARLQTAEARAPEVAVQLGTLVRARDGIADQHAAASAALVKAASGERIEAMKKGQRISLVEPAIVPTRPSDPPREILVLMAALAALGCGFAAVVGTELLGRKVRRGSDLTKAFGITPLVTIPVLRPERAPRKGPADTFAGFGLASALAILALGAVLGLTQGDKLRLFGAALAGTRAEQTFIEPEITISRLVEGHNGTRN